jgi:hypothetical protein
MILCLAGLTVPIKGRFIAIYDITAERLCPAFVAASHNFNK